jgi:hypothetical protein
MSSIEERILADLNDIRIKQMQNGIAVAQGLPVPNPELTAEAHQREVERSRHTYMYGYGLSFQDDRELKAFEEGRLVF